MSCLETPSFWRYKENYATLNAPEKFQDFRETGPWPFQASIRNYLKCVHNCDDHGLLNFFTSSPFKAIFAWQSWFFLASWPKSNSNCTVSSFSLCLRFCPVIRERILNSNSLAQNGHCKHSCQCIGGISDRLILSSHVWPSLLVRWEFVVAFVYHFPGFCWIIRTSRDRTFIIS